MTGWGGIFANRGETYTLEVYSHRWQPFKKNTVVHFLAPDLAQLRS